MASTGALAQGRSCASVSPSPNTVEHRKLKKGKNSIRPAGTVQVRVASPPNVAARNHTCPVCPTLQNCPVVSNTGLATSGIERAHCHHLAPHSPYVAPIGWEFGGRTPGFGFPAAWTSEIMAIRQTTVATPTRRQYFAASLSMSALHRIPCAATSPRRVSVSASISAAAEQNGSRHLPP